MIKRCRALLAAAEKKIELLSADDKAPPATTPLPEPEPDDEQE
jgi:exonuclease VII small subunit